MSLKAPRWSLRAQTSVVFASVVLLTVTATSAVDAYFDLQHLRQHTVDQNMRDAVVAAALVQEIFEDIEHSLTAVAHSGELRRALAAGDAPRLNAALEEAPRDSRLTALLIVDRTRAQVATSSPDKSRNGLILEDANIPEILQSGKPKVGDPRRGALTGLPIVPVGVPVIGPDEATIGVLQGTASLEPIADHLRNFSAGRAGHVSVIAPDGTILIHPDERRVLTKSAGTNRIVAEALQGRIVSGETLTSSGDTVYAAAAPAPSLGWAVQSQVPAEVVASKMREDLERAALSGALVLALVVGGGLQLVPRLTGRVRRLRMATQRIARGAYEPGMLDVRSRDEIGDLARDIDAMAREVAAAHAAIAASEERLSLALSAAGLGLWDWDVTRDEGYLSPLTWRMLGYDEGGSERVGLDFVASTFHPDDAPSVTRTMKEHLRGETEQWTSEYRMRRASGEYAWIRGVGRVVERTSEGAPLRMIGVIMDISDQKRAEEAQRRAAELAGQLRGITLAARELTHVLNNRLQLPLAVLDLLQERPDVAPETRALARQAMGDVRSAAEHVARLNRVVRVETKQTVVGTALDLARSTEPSGNSEASTPGSEAPGSPAPKSD